MDNVKQTGTRTRKNDPVHGAQLIEADVKGIRWSSLGGHPCGNDNENRIARDICALLESFKPQRADSNVRSVWFRIPRGTVDDWMSAEDFRDYAEMYDEPEEEVAAERLRSWAEWFPTYVYGADDIAYALRGEDDLLVAPFNENIWYRGSEHFGRHAVTCVHLPEEGAEPKIGDIEWADQPVPQLKTQGEGEEQ